MFLTGALIFIDQIKNILKESQSDFLKMFEVFFASFYRIKKTMIIFIKKNISNALNERTS